MKKQPSSSDNHQVSESESIELPLKKKQKVKQVSQKTSSRDKINKIEAASQESAELSEKKYICRFCDKKFKICAALGGHISKAHPGQSESYNHKKRVRAERQLERELHKLAIL